jgi:acetyltransferase-like isoleucine patch superfamily enzyme
MRPTFVNRVARYLGRSGPLQRICNRARFPGMAIDDDVVFDVAGEFHYGTGCTIGSGANLIVPHGASLTLAAGCYVGRHVELGPAGEIRIGSDTSIQDRCILLGVISIGRYCTLAPNIYASSGRHYFDLEPASLIRDQDARASCDPQLAAHHHRPVVVEDDCWLGINSVIMPGVTVGKGAVVGAGAVVTRDVEPYAVMVGSPAKPIRKRLEFSPPRRLNYRSAEDRPYFYAGFEISQASMARNDALGGLLALGGFTLCLKVQDMRTLHLVAKTADAAAGVLSLGGQQRPVAARFEELVFECGAGDGRDRIRVECSPPHAAVIVQQAWVQ